MRRVCPDCHAVNRIPARHLAEAGKCGKCRAVLPPHGAPIDVASAAQFDEIIAAAQVPVLVDFCATWCAPCRAMSPEVEQVAHTLAGRAIVLRVDTDAHDDLVRRYLVASFPKFPAFAVFRGGRLVRQRVGAIDARQLERFAISPQ